MVKNSFFEIAGVSKETDRYWSIALKIALSSGWSQTKCVKSIRILQMFAKN